MATNNKSTEELAFQATIDLKKWKKELNTMEKGLKDVDKESSEAWLKQQKLIEETEKDLEKYNKELAKTGAGTKKMNTLTGASVLKFMALGKAVQFAVTKVVELGQAMYGFVKSSADAEIAMLGLQSATNAVGESFDEAKGYAEDLASSGLVTIETTTLAMKQLISMGHTAQEAFDMTKAIQDIAAYGNIVGDVDQAVRDATKGLKTNSVELTENAGLMGRQADIYGHNYDKLTELEKQQARYNYVMKEGTKATGDFNKLEETTSGHLSTFETDMKNTAKAIGELFTPMVKQATDAISGMGDKLQEFNTQTQKNRLKQRMGSGGKVNRGYEGLLSSRKINQLLSEDLEVAKLIATEKELLMKDGTRTDYEALVQAEKNVKWQLKLTAVSASAKKASLAADVSIAEKDKIHKKQIEEDDLAHKKKMAEQERLATEAFERETKRQIFLDQMKYKSAARFMTATLKNSKKGLKEAMAIALQSTGIVAFQSGMSNWLHGKAEVAHGTAIMAIPGKQGQGSREITQGKAEQAVGMKLMKYGGAAAVAGTAAIGGSGDSGGDEYNNYDIDTDVSDTTDSLEEQQEKETIRYYIDDEEQYALLAKGLHDHAKDKDIEIIYTGGK